MLPYQVFISFKRTRPDGRSTTRDYELAADLHRTLTDKGVKVFFSERDLSSSAYVRELFQALDEATILIVVGTRPEYVKSEWVRNEWETFLTAILGKRKQDAELYTYLEGMSVNELPIELYNRHSFTSAEKGVLVKRVLNNLGRQYFNTRQKENRTPKDKTDKPIEPSIQQPVELPEAPIVKEKGASDAVQKSDFNKSIIPFLPALKIFGIEMGILIVDEVIMRLVGRSFGYWNIYTGWEDETFEFSIPFFSPFSFLLTWLNNLHILFGSHSEKFGGHILDCFIIHFIVFSAIIILGVLLTRKWCPTKKQKIMTTILLPTHWYSVFFVFFLIFIGHEQMYW